MSGLSASVLEDITALRDPSSMQAIASLATRCAQHLAQAAQVADHVEQTLQAYGTSDDDAASRDRRTEARLALWLLIDKLCKQHELFVEAFRSKLVPLAGTCAPAPISEQQRFGLTEVGSSAQQVFLMIADSWKVFFGPSMVALIKLKANAVSVLSGGSRPTETPESTAVKSTASAAGSSGSRPHEALIVHSAQLRTMGSFVTKQTNSNRTGAEKGALCVRTVDSSMAMAMASAYAPARPMEIQIAVAARDADAPQGFVQAVPESHHIEYEAERRKRLREVMEANRQEDDRRARERMMSGSSQKDVELLAKGVDFSDVVMPEELPRDEFGVKRANFPQGVRFLRDAIRDCGGAVELEVIVQRLSTLANKEVASEFGDVREFLLIHKPTFTIVMEDDKWVVRLAPSAYGGADAPGASSASWQPAVQRSAGRFHFMHDSERVADAFGPLDTSCPFCTRLLKSRNLARHVNCRRCITSQMAFGVTGTIRSPISELGYAAKLIIDNRRDFDDDDLEWFGCCIERAASIPRFRLGSPNKFAPVLKAIRVVRDEWLRRHNLSPTVSVEAIVPSLEPGDMVFAEFFNIVGSNLFRLPLAWIETGDIIDMCSHFCRGVKPAHQPPPRPADPRISIYNSYPGMLLCESEVDSEDDPSDEEKEFSDDEGETFQFAPPVSTVETLTVAGFDRDTKRLNHKLRTAPPLVLTRVLRGDGSQTHNQLYAAAAKETTRRVEAAPSVIATAPSHQRNDADRAPQLLAASGRLGGDKVSF